MDLALFDFDGTITEQGAFPIFLRYAVRPHRQLFWGLVLLPTIVAYKLGRPPAATLRETIAGRGLRGEPIARLQALGERFAAEVMPGLVRPLAAERLAWHKARGDRIVIVSASLDVYLAPWCRAQGVELICTQLETRDGRVTGRYRGGDCFGEEKSRRIHARLGDLSGYGTIYAYGDTAEDDEMLALAHKRYFRWEEAGDVAE